VCNALWAKVANLNRVRHSIGSQWSCLSSTVDVHTLLQLPPNLACGKFCDERVDYIQMCNLEIDLLTIMLL